jgi:hypothetical protein
MIRKIVTNLSNKYNKTIKINKNLLIFKIISNKNNLVRNFNMKNNKIVDNLDNHLCQENLCISLQ